MEELHEGSDRDGRDHPSRSSSSAAGRRKERAPSKPLLLRKFAWKHLQDPVDSARLGDFNAAMRSSDDQTASAASPAARVRKRGGAMTERSSQPSPASPHDGREEAGAFVGVAATPSAKPVDLGQRVITPCKTKKPRVADGAQHHRVRAEEAAHAARTEPNGAIRSPPTPPARTEKATMKEQRRQPVVPGGGKVHAGGGHEAGSSSSSQSTLRRPKLPSNHHVKVDEAAEIDDEEAFELGLEVAMAMDPAELKAAVDKFFGVDEHSRPQRRLTVQREDAPEKPPFDFRLPKEQAMADVTELLRLKKRRKDN